MRIVKKNTWVLFFGIMAISCLDQPDCYRLNSDEIGISFRVLGTNKADAVSLTGIQVNNIIGYPDTTLSSFLIPLNYLENETSLSIAGTGVNGSMLLKYLSQAQFVSDECGPRFILSNLSIAEKSGFDSVRLLTSELNNPPYINIEIYRCPTTNLVKFDFHQLYVSTNGKKTSQPLLININNIKADYSGELFYLNTALNTMTLPVDLKTGASDFFITSNGQVDTVALIYTLKEEERYNVCPLSTYVSGMQVTSPDLDSVSIAIVDKKKIDAPQDPATTNVLIFKCPQTNLMKVYFKTQKVEGGSFVSYSVSFVGIKNNFSADVFYADKIVSTVELPINELALESEYYFEMKDKDGNVSVDTLTVNYESNTKTIFNACGVQRVYNNLIATSPDLKFPTKPVVKDSLQFPSVTNIEIIKP